MSRVRRRDIVSGGSGAPSPVGGSSSMKGDATASPSPSSDVGTSSPAFSWAKVFDREHDWSRDELGDIVHWGRQVLGILCGLIWGTMRFTGGLFFLLFMALNFGLGFLYYSVILRVDEEEFGGHMALLQEGTMPSIGLFLLTWILVYTTLSF
eukprot:TRINITY_DN430_c0_g2_i1.p2 TRINITY_DN430_c0_g2~~TRINITY_DN430_c0_g2_i1.p2  ORF type:complete len:152 (+),score=25.53 TRINITY_DN430_c0_g2_i1:301-756(+)